MRRTAAHPARGRTTYSSLGHQTNPHSRRGGGGSWWGVNVGMFMDHPDILTIFRDSVLTGHNRSISLLPTVYKATFIVDWLRRGTRMCQKARFEYGLYRHLVNSCILSIWTNPIIPPNPQYSCHTSNNQIHDKTISLMNACSRTWASQWTFERLRRLLNLGPAIDFAAQLPATIGWYRLACTQNRTYQRGTS